jgi:hypothetical protein
MYLLSDGQSILLTLNYFNIVTWGMPGTPASKSKMKVLFKDKHSILFVAASMIKLRSFVKATPSENILKLYCLGNDTLEKIS